MVFPAEKHLVNILTFRDVDFFIEIGPHVLLVVLFKGLAVLLSQYLVAYPVYDLEARGSVIWFRYFLLISVFVSISIVFLSSVDIVLVVSTKF
jgi:hypothetical protein